MKETLSVLGFDQSTTLYYKHFIKTVEIIQQGLENNDKFQPTLNGSLSYSQMELIGTWAFNIGVNLLYDDWFQGERLKPVDDALFIYTHYLNKSIETAKTLASIAQIYENYGFSKEYISTMELSMAMRLHQTVFTCDEWEDIPSLVTETSRLCILFAKEEEASIFIPFLFDLHRLLQRNCPTIDADNILSLHMCGSLYRFHGEPSGSKDVTAKYVDLHLTIKLLEGIINQLSGNYQKEIEHTSNDHYDGYPAFKGLEDKIISISSDQCHKIATIASRLSLDELNNKELETLSFVYQEIGLLYYEGSTLEKATFALNEALKIRLHLYPELRKHSTQLPHQKHLQPAVLAHALGDIY